MSLDLSLFWLVVLILFIGPSYRFLAILTPFIIMKTASFLDDIRIILPRFALLTIASVLIFETAYAVNSQVINYPIGAKFWTYSRLRYDDYNWGYNELERFLEKEFLGKMPAISLNLQYKFLQDVQNAGLEKARQKRLTPYPALIIYDSNLPGPALLWSLDRRQIYHGWPTLKTEDYLEILEQNGADYFRQAGIKTHYFIIPTGNVPLKQKLEGETNLVAAEFERNLAQAGIAPVFIHNKRSEPVFKIYKF